MINLEPVFSHSFLQLLVTSSRVNIKKSYLTHLISKIGCYCAYIESCMRKKKKKKTHQKICSGLSDIGKKE